MTDGNQSAEISQELARSLMLVWSCGDYRAVPVHWSGWAHCYWSHDDPSSTVALMLAVDPD